MKTADFVLHNGDTFSTDRKNERQAMKKLFDLEFFQEGDICLKDTCAGEVLLSPTGPGRFLGETLKGEVVPAGMGITYTPEPGKNDVEASVLLRTEDGFHILMDIKAYLDIDEEQEQKLMTGESVSPADYYYKGVVSFKTGCGRYKWLERKICVCCGEIVSWEQLLFRVYIV